jgi:hypothetical protein
MRPGGRAARLVAGLAAILTAVGALAACSTAPGRSGDDGPRPSDAPRSPQALPDAYRHPVR